MAVIIREERSIAGKMVPNVKAYMTEYPPVTKQVKERAERLDKLLEEKMREIERTMEQQNLLKLKGKSGVLKLWYEVGKRLKFVMETDLVDAADRKFIWRALYNHAGKLAPGPVTVRAAERPEQSHFAYCYKLASKFPSWEFIQRAGDWTAWSEFLDSIVIRGDKRIIQWMAEKQKEKRTISMQDWLRPLTREIRRRFKRYDTSEYSDKDLKKELEVIFKKVFSQK